ncbi:MAG TPA: hypothetical protein PK990_09170, partial [Salinivirgaceae bacterium]|nr:hypothetical protein [Salinivirgaceae bacterium]
MINFNDYNKLRKLLLDPNYTVRIFETPIDVELQKEYFAFSSELRKENNKQADYLSQVWQLYDPTVPIEDKKRILCMLASVDNIDYYRSLEQFEKMAPDELKNWATLALYESKTIIESGFLNSNMVIVSSGLGAKNNSLRYFIVLIAKNDEGFSTLQYDIIRNETEFAFREQGGEVEEINKDGRFVKIVCLLPIEQYIGELIQSIIRLCNTFGDFLAEDFILTNTKLLSVQDIENFLKESGRKN